MARKYGFIGGRSFSKVKETAYDTPLTSDWIGLAHLGGDPIQRNPVLITNDDEVQATEENDEQNIIAWEVTGDHNMRLTPEGVAFFLAFGLGSVSSHVDGGGVFTHTISPRPKTFMNDASSTTDEWPIVVDDTGSFPSSGTLVVETTGAEIVYTGKSATQFTNGGSPAHTAIADNAPIVLKPSLNPPTLPSFTLLEDFEAAQQYQYSGMMVDSLNISIERKQFATLTAGLVGSGTYTEVSTSITAPTAESLMKAGSVNVLKGGTFAGITMSGGSGINGILQSFTYDLNNNIEGDEGWLFNDSFSRGRGQRTRRTQTVSAVIEFDDETYTDHLLNQDEVTLEIIMTGVSPYIVRMIFPQLKFTVAPISGGVELLIQNAEIAVEWDSLYGSIMVNVTNNADDYLEA